MMDAREQPSDLVTTASGLLVPAAAIDSQPDEATGRLGVLKRPTAYDPDGRRRIGMSKADRRQVDRAVAILNRQGIAVVLQCFARFDGKASCREPMAPEDKGGPDHGFGCACSRLHFLGV